MNPILKSLSEGYEPDEIIQFITKAIPSVASRVRKAKQTGHSASSILDFLTKITGDDNYPRSMSQAELEEAIGKKQEGLVKDVLKKGALTLGTGMVAGRVLQNAPKIANQLGNLFGRKPVPPAPPQMASAPVAETFKTVGQAVPETFTPSKEIFETTKNVLSKTNIGKEIEKIYKSKDLKGIREIISKKITPEERQLIEQQTGMNSETAALDYAALLKRGNEKISNKDVNQSNSFAESAKELFEQPFGKIEEATQEMPSEESRKIKKEKGIKKLVSLPSGEMGNLIEERQGIGSVELPNGEVRRRKVEDLVEGPEDAAVTALELIKSFTPEQERSAHHAMSFYDPEGKEAFFMFHNGSAYKVNDISAEEYERLSTEVDMAKTAGTGSYGVWSTGEGSRGAAYNAIIKNLKKPYKKLQVGYNILKEWQRLVHEHEKKQKRKRPL